jgi:hypothetical protein
MRKIVVLLMMLALFAVACGKEAAKAEKAGAGAAKSAEEVKAMLVGEWEATTLGDVLGQYGFGTPAKFVFTEDGKYEWYFMKDGNNLVGTGTFKVVEAGSEPYKVDFIQEKTGVPGGELKDAPMESAGIIGFMQEGEAVVKMRTIFYNKKFLPRPEEFGDTDTQVYKKVK